MFEIRQKTDGRWKVVADGKLLEIFATEAEARAWVEAHEATPPRRRYYRRRETEE